MLPFPKEFYRNMPYATSNYKKIIIRFGDQSKQGLAAGLPLLGLTLQELHRSVLLTLFLDFKKALPIEKYILQMPFPNLCFVI